MTNSQPHDIIKTEKRKRRTKNMTYEVIINGKVALTTNNQKLAESTFDFYRRDKKAFRIEQIALLCAELHYFFEG